MVLTLLLTLSSAHAQNYAFPTTATYYSSFYPTAYYDHAGVDWDCGDLTYGGHNGNDFGGGGFAGMDAGRDIAAAADGIVINTEDGNFDRCTTGDCPGGGGFGNYISVMHADGKKTYYGHLRSGSVQVVPGESVRCGQVIAQMGSSGKSTGPHIHFGVRDASGSWADPFYGSCNSPPSWWSDQGVHGALPSLTCDVPAPCDPIGTLSCGDVVQGNNTMGGSTNTHVFYGCGEWTYSGSEVSWQVVTNLDEPVRVEVTGMSADLDLYLMQAPGCGAIDCLASSDGSASSDESVSFDAIANTPYLIALDGWESAATDFTLTVICNGSAPSDTADTADTASPTPHDTGRSPNIDTGADPPAHDKLPQKSTGCGCNSRSPTGAGWALLVVLATLRRSRWPTSDTPPV